MKQLFVLFVLMVIAFTSYAQVYKMYKTRNYHNQLRLNKYELVENNERCIFSIQPLTSMYQYYLINDNTGDMWKFQWSTKGDDYRWIKSFR